MNLQAVASTATANLDDQYKNEPILRPIIDLGMVQRDRSRHKKLPRASILVLLFRHSTEDEWQVLLTRRPLRLKSHPGEVCCPGGRQDSADGGDDVVTALRETREEVGIHPEEITILARMETVESVGGLCVTPVLGMWQSPLLASQLSTNPDEVEAVFYVPLSYFWNDANCQDPYEVDWRGESFIMRTYIWKDLQSDPPKTFKIWGLTAHVVYEVANLCHPQPTTRASLQPSTTTSGLLFRWIDEAGSKPYWSQRYFVLTTTAAIVSDKRILHQYDSEQQAATKASAATKKNRLQLDSDGCQVAEGPMEVNGTFTFDVSILEGRITWKLAAATREERTRWVAALKANTCTDSSGGSSADVATKRFKTGHD